jgi:HD-GYP domain-containing protein (c-di-GMP phosphodiesterase class II)
VNELRLADPLIGLSAIGDLGRGLEPGHAARTCFIGCRLARELGAGDETVREVFFAALLQHIGCVAHAHDTASLDRGRTLEVLAAADRTDFSRPADIVSVFLTELTQGGDLLRRMRLLLPAARMGKVVERTSCEIAEMTARRIGLPDGVRSAVHFMNEWFNGKGIFKRKGEEIPISSRVVLAAFTVSIFDRLGGADAAVEAARARAGKSLDPAVADAFARSGPKILEELESIDVLASVPGEEPDPNVCVGRDSLDEIAIAFGEAVDLKTPYTHGSAGRAFELAGKAATALGLERKVVAETRRAAALRDIGNASLPNAILEKPGRLTEIELEQMRLHPYQTERVLGRSPVFAEEKKLAGLHHERADGSGYHRGLSGAAVPMAARVIAAVDVFVAITQPRPHREAISADDACAHLRKDRGLDPDAVDAVVAAVHDRGRPVRRRATTGLTDRQIDVLRLVAQGLNNRQIAEQLFVSPRTAERHVQDIYLKIGASSRAAAALFAIENELL